jgi:hypothetical protein
MVVRQLAKLETTGRYRPGAQKTSRGRAEAARLAHNQEVGGSSPPHRY